MRCRYTSCSCSVVSAVAVVFAAVVAAAVLLTLPDRCKLDRSDKAGSINS